MNSGTHELELFLFLLTAKDMKKRKKGRQAHSIVACSVYSIALLVLYTHVQLFNIPFLL
jgi:hypothetical protein